MCVGYGSGGCHSTLLNRLSTNYSVCVCVWSMEVKAIDYFNPPICESVILVALHSTGESLMGLSAARLRPLPIQLTFNWNLPGESRGLGPGMA